MKKVLIIVGIIAVVAIVFFAIPMNMKVDRAVTINADRALVYNNVSKFEIFEQWSPWAQMDPSQEVTVTGEDGQVGAKMAWVSESDEVGSGSQEITKATQDRIEMNLEFTAPWQSKSLVYYDFSGEDGNVTVNWGYEGEGNLLTKLMVEGMLGENYEQGLTDLKKMCEQ